jgi:DNA-binding CsgD family transcriptional regulator
MDVLANAGPAGAVLSDGKAALGAGLALVMDELAYGVVIATVAGQVLHANQAARHELARRRALLASNNLLHTHAPQDRRKLHDGLLRAVEGKRSLLTLAASEGTALTLAVVPLRADAPPRSAALVFARASVCESLMLCFFARSHGLTATEEHVLGILCQGYSAPDIARQMKVAVSTIRSHVRSLCAKTRSSGVRELVNRVAVLPPVAPALWQEPMH